VLADRAHPCPLRDDSTDAAVRRGGFEHDLSADREPNAADAPVRHVSPLLEPSDRSVDILRALPAEDVRVAVASVIAACVDEQDSVAMAEEHARLREPALTGRV
jgi:hypothetical protein